MTIEERKQFEEDLKNKNVRQFHADSLNRIFRGTIGHITESQITPEVAKASQFLEGEILKSKRAMAIALEGIQGTLALVFAYRLMDLTYKAVKGSTFARGLEAADILKTAEAGLAVEYNTIHLSAYNKNRLYKAVVDKINVNWKSSMGLLLYGIIDELPY